MKTITKAALVLVLCGGVLLASQENARVYVGHCICDICSYFFGD